MIKPVEQSWYEFKEGVIFVTNERIIFVAPKNGFEKKLKTIQFWRNLFNNRCSKGVLKRVLNNVVKKDGLSKKSFGEVINRIRNLVSGRELDVYKKGVYYTNSPYKLAPSARTQFEYVLSIINGSKNNNNFISCIDSFSN